VCVCVCGSNTWYIRMGIDLIASAIPAFDPACACVCVCRSNTCSHFSHTSIRCCVCVGVCGCVYVDLTHARASAIPPFDPIQPSGAREAILVGRRAAGRVAQAHSHWFGNLSFRLPHSVSQFSCMCVLWPLGKKYPIFSNKINYKEGGKKANDFFPCKKRPKKW